MSPLTADDQPWWEGLAEARRSPTGRVARTIRRNGPAAHPNSRFTVSAKQCPSWSPRAEDAHGVPISAIVFGGRRPSLVPLVFEARDWAHGVLVGAAMGSETTAAATGAVGVLRRDSMAMKPFCGYNFADYFAHWLSFDKPGAKLPKIFHVNWFRKGADGKFLWPGFGENLRVLEWMIERCDGKADARRNADRRRAAQAATFDVDGLRLPDRALDRCSMSIPKAGARSSPSIGDYLDRSARACRRSSRPSRHALLTRSRSRFARRGRRRANRRAAWDFARRIDKHRRVEAADFFNRPRERHYDRGA